MQQSQILIQNSLECFQTEYFENQDLEALICPIGLGILNNPVFDPCGHAYCKYCITQWLSKQQCCPSNKNPLTLEQLTPALPIRNLVENLKLNCFNRCGWKGRLNNYEKHDLNECPEKNINCTNEKCQEKVKRKDLEFHKSEQCAFQTIKCNYCAQPFPKADLLLHEQQCNHRMVRCDQCHEQIQFISLISHQQNECIQSCGELIKLVDLDKHTKDPNHILKLSSTITKLTNELKEMSQMYAQQQMHIQQLQQLQIPPYFEGWKMSVKKLSPTREWLTASTMNKVGSSFTIKFEISGLQAKSNSWRAAIGISSKKQTQQSWYKDKEVQIIIYLNQTFVYILGGYKCQGGEAPIKYGEELEGDFTLTMTVNQQGQLIFDQNQKTFWPAFTLDRQQIENGFYVVASLINLGKIRIVSLEQI